APSQHSAWRPTTSCSWQARATICSAPRRSACRPCGTTGSAWRPPTARRRRWRSGRRSIPWSTFSADEVRVPVKTIFIDCTDQLAPLFGRAHGPDDPPITVNRTDAADVPALVDGYDACVVDHTYLSADLLARCRTL